MASYKIDFSTKALKDLRSLSQSLNRRILPKIEELQFNPRPAGCRKLSGHEDKFRIRIGDYRVLYTIDDGLLIIGIERVRHRKDVYR